MNKKNIRDIDVAGKKVLVRVDFNVPIKEGKVKDATRIAGAVPTIQYLLDHGAAVLLCSHLGRPKGGPDAQFSLAPVAPVLAKYLNREVKFSADAVGPNAEAAAAALQAGEVLLLENTRFYPGEEKNNLELAQQFAALADIYVNDAFGSAHRAHSSTAGVAQYLPAVAGFLMEKEVQYLAAAVNNPEHPFVAILGGAKISDKIGVIRNLLGKADHVLIGGGMANTFYAAKGIAIADSLVEAEAVATATELLAADSGKILLPSKVVIADAFSADANTRTISISEGVPAGWRILDVLPDEFAPVIAGAKLIVWNGPMGVFEMPIFAAGTNAVARMVANSAAISVVGGGDSVAAINQSGLSGQITHISTGGGASLEMLEGLELPGVAALLDQ
jgi:phosphoglycerate kinase